MSLATVLTVVILNTGAKILVEGLSFCALILRVHVFEMWMLVWVEFWRYRMIRVDWMYGWWRIDMLGILVVVMWVFMMRVFAGIDICLDIWFDIARVIFRSWNAVSTPRVIKDLMVIFFSNAQVIIITMLMERILPRIWGGATSSQADKLKEARTRFLIPYIFELSSFWEFCT